MRTEQAGANRLGTLHTDLAVALNSYRAELSLDMLDEQGSMLDWVIGYAFDTLDACRLDLRILPCDTCSFCEF